MIVTASCQTVCLDHARHNHCGSPLKPQNSGFQASKVPVVFFFVLFFLYCINDRPSGTCLTPAFSKFAKHLPLSSLQEIASLVFLYFKCV